MRVVDTGLHLSGLPRLHLSTRQSPAENHPALSAKLLRAKRVAIDRDRHLALCDTPPAHDPSRHFLRMTFPRQNGLAHPLYVRPPNAGRDRQPAWHRANRPGDQSFLLSPTKISAFERLLHSRQREKRTQ